MLILAPDHHLSIGGSAPPRRDTRRPGARDPGEVSPEGTSAGWRSPGSGRSPPQSAWDHVRLAKISTPHQELVLAISHSRTRATRCIRGRGVRRDYRGSKSSPRRRSQLAASWALRRTTELLLLGGAPQRDRSAHAWGLRKFLRPKTAGAAPRRRCVRSGSGRPVVDREFRCRVNVLWREQHHGFRRRSPGGVDNKRSRRSAAIVRKVQDNVRVGLAECEVEALKAPAETLGHFRHHVPPARSTGALNALRALCRIRRLHQELRHVMPPQFVDRGETLTHSRREVNPARSGSGSQPRPWRARTIVPSELIVSAIATVTCAGRRTDHLGPSYLDAAATDDSHLLLNGNARLRSPRSVWEKVADVDQPRRPCPSL